MSYTIATLKTVSASTNSICSQEFEDIFETAQNIQLRYNFKVINLTGNSTQNTLQIIPFMEYKKNGQLSLQFSIVDHFNPANSTRIDASISAASSLKHSVVIQPSSMLSSVLNTNLSMPSLSHLETLHNNLLLNDTSLESSENHHDSLFGGLKISDSTQQQSKKKMAKWNLKRTSRFENGNSAALSQNSFELSRRDTLLYNHKQQQSQQQQSNRLLQQSHESRCCCSTPYSLRKFPNEIKEEFIQSQYHHQNHNGHFDGSVDCDSTASQQKKFSFDFSCNNSVKHRCRDSICQPIHENNETNMNNNNNNNINTIVDDPNKKGNAVNMAKNILKGFLDYVFVSGKPVDIIDACSTPLSASLINSALPQADEEEDNQEIDEENNDNEEKQMNEDKLQLSTTTLRDSPSLSISSTATTSTTTLLPLEQLLVPKVSEHLTVDGIRKRFRKQYNSRMLERPSNSKLLKFFTNVTYGKLFAKYFSSEEILSYVQHSNIQNKLAHVDLIMKIRSTDYDIDRLQDVLKTRIFKRPVPLINQPIVA